ncbi:hypothetical protein AAVH_04051 [Aphelenchoides avenae]|nr:hypothetical protein AAVH_04051 [Aphelenchus avenae]
MLENAPLEAQRAVNVALTLAAAYIVQRFLRCLWSLTDLVPREAAIELSPAAKLAIMESLRAGWYLASLRQLIQTGPDYAYLCKHRHYFTTWDGQRYVHTDELRMTLATLAEDGFQQALEAVFDVSREQLVFRVTFPRHDFLQRLIEEFASSATPRNLRSVMLIAERDWPEATSASFHLPQVYDSVFPCVQCTGYRPENEIHHSFVEVFHFPNRYDADAYATVSFRMPANRRLFDQFDTFFEVLRHADPDGLEKLEAVRAGWGSIIDRHKELLPRRKVYVDINFYGWRPAMITVVVWRWNGKYEQVVRTLVARGPQQLSRMLHDHLRDSVVKMCFFFVDGSVSFRDPPQDAMFHCARAKAVDWIASFLRSLKTIQLRSVCFDTELTGYLKLSALMKAAQEACGVGTFEVINPVRGAFAMRQMTALLHDPTVVAAKKLIIRTWVPLSMNFATLEGILFSSTSPALVRFLSAENEVNFIREFLLIMSQYDGAEFADLPPPHRVRQFRHIRYGEEITTRVHAYRNQRTKEVLSVVRHAPRTYRCAIMFMNGNVALDDLRSRWTNEKYCDL